MVKNRTEILFFCASNFALSHTFLEKFAAARRKAPFPNRKRGFVKR